MSLTIGSLFTGCGGLDLAVAEVLDAHTIWTSDIEARDKRGVLVGNAPAIIAHRFLDAPNLGDITSIDWDAVQQPDILTGGWPCQPWSVAGKRKGAADERALWPWVERAVRMVRPRLVILENVPTIATAGELARAVSSLAILGYVGVWGCLPASAVGAPHRRRRIFIAAADASVVNGDWIAAAIQAPSGRTQPPTPRHDRASVDLLPTPTSRDGKGLNQRGDDTCLPGALLLTPRAADAFATMGAAGAARHAEKGFGSLGDGPNQRGSSGDLTPPSAVHVFGRYARAVTRWEQVFRPAPPPTNLSRKGKPKLNPEFASWMMGLPEHWVTGVPGLSDNQALYAIGNAVCPPHAAAALHLLLPRLSAALGLAATP